MLQLKYPGVYTREIPSGVRTISAAPTSVALFIGPTATGVDGRAMRIQNFGDFERQYGGLSRTSNLSYSVLHFFANGGGDAFVIRVPPKNAVAATGRYKRDGTTNSLSFELKALSAGIAGNAIMVEIDAFNIGAEPFTVNHKTKLFNLTIINRTTGQIERFSNLSASSSSSRFAPTVINDIGTGSKLVSMSLTGAAIDSTAPQMTGSVYSIGTPLTAGTFAADIKLQVSIDVLLDTGAANAAASTANLEVVAFPNGSAKPVGALEFANRLGAAINAAIRADPIAAPKMLGLEVEAASFESGRLLRLRVAAPGAAPLAARIADATVTIADPAGAGTKLLATYAITENANAKNNSRYILGMDYGTDSTVVGVRVMGPAVKGSDGDANGQPDTNAFKAAVMGQDIPDPYFNILCLPDLVRPSEADPMAPHHGTAAMAIYAEAALVCRKKHAFLLVDVPPNVVDTASAEFLKSVGLNFQSSHGAVYFPNIRVDDPLETGSIRSHPPSGAIAGLFARTDAQFGVWQAPAGTEASLSGVYGPSFELSDDQHGVLNPLGLNCIRKFPIYQTVCFGSRTIDGANAQGSEWKYIPVRRTASFILRSLSEGLRWAVHKPNGEQLWSQLRLNTTAFMHSLFRQGAFKGTSSREAYFVQCDASTTSADDINQGVVNIVVGFAPLKPAEFVVISLRQIVQPLV